MANRITTSQPAPKAHEAGNIARARPREEGRGHLLHRMQREMERLLGPGFGMAVALAGVETRDEPEHLVVRVEAPGHPAENLEVLANEHYLTIRSLPPKAGGEPGASTEPRAVHAVIPLPEGADRDKVEATYSNGLLVVRVPKGPHGKTRKIPLKDA